MFTKILSETIVSIKQLPWCFFFPLDPYVMTGWKYFKELLLSQPESDLGRKWKCANKRKRKFSLLSSSVPERISL